MLDGWTSRMKATCRTALEYVCWSWHTHRCQEVTETGTCSSTSTWTYFIHLFRQGQKLSKLQQMLSECQSHGYKAQDQILKRCWWSLPIDGSHASKQCRNSPTQPVNTVSVCLRLSDFCPWLYKNELMVPRMSTVYQHDSNDKWPWRMAQKGCQ